MGIWDCINSATVTVKNNIPSVASVTQVYQTSSNYGWSAISSIGKAVKSVPIPVQKLSESVQDQETQSKIKGFASVLGKNAAELALQESIKLLPGGVLISRSVSEYQKSGDGKDKKIKELEDEICRLRTESYIAQKSTDEIPEMLLKNKAVTSGLPNAVARSRI